MKIILLRSNGHWNTYPTHYALGLFPYEKEGRYFSKFWIALKIQNPFPYGFWYGLKNKWSRFWFTIFNPDIWFLESSYLPNKIYFKI